MKKVVRIVALALALSMVPLTGCNKPKDASGKSGESNPAETSKNSNFSATGYPIVKEKVTLKILIPNTVDHPKDMNEIPIISRQEQITNVHAEWIMPGTGFNEKKSLMLASGDLPDIILSGVTTAEVAKYSSDGTLIAMNDLIDKYAPNLKQVFSKDPRIVPYITAPDGKIYITPRVNAGPWMRTSGIGTINKSWLDKLGLNVPTNLAELHTVLKAFKEKDPNGNGKADEIPFTFQVGASLNRYPAMAYIMGSFGINAKADRIVLRNDKVVLDASLPEYKEAIQYLASLYKDGLVDPEGFTQTFQQFSAKLGANPLTVGYFNTWDVNDDVPNADNRKQFVYVPPMADPKGQMRYVANNALLPGYDRSGAVITKGCKNPEVAIRYIDYVYDTNNSMEMIEGEMGKRLQKQPEGYYVIAPPPAGMTAQQYRSQSSPGNSGIWAVFEDTYRNTLRLTYTDPKVKFQDDYIMKYADKNPAPALFYTAEEGNTYNTMNTDILNYVERKTSEWIMKGTIDAEWDSFLKELDKMGYQNWLKINNDAYGRYKKAEAAKK